MAYVSHEHRLLFYAAPATGSTAFIKALQDRGIGEYYPAESIHGAVTVPAKHSSPAQLEAAGLLEPVEHYTKVSGVRNLFSWLVAKHVRNTTLRKQNLANPKSWIYQKPEPERSRIVARVKADAEITFENYIRKMCRREGYPNSGFHIGIDFFLHQEGLDSDFAILRDRLGLPGDLTIPQHNVTGKMPAGKTWRDYYGPELRALVEASPFFERFPEYDFEGFHPSRIR